MRWFNSRMSCRPAAFRLVTGQSKCAAPTGGEASIFDYRTCRMTLLPSPPTVPNTSTTPAVPQPDTTNNQWATILKNDGKIVARSVYGDSLYQHIVTVMGKVRKLLLGALAVVPLCCPKSFRKRLRLKWIVGRLLIRNRIDCGRHVSCRSLDRMDDGASSPSNNVKTRLFVHSTGCAHEQHPQKESHIEQATSISPQCSHGTISLRCINWYCIGSTDFLLNF